MTPRRATAADAPYFLGFMTKEPILAEIPTFLGCRVAYAATPSGRRFRLPKVDNEIRAARLVDNATGETVEDWIEYRVTETQWQRCEELTDEEPT